MHRSERICSFVLDDCHLLQFFIKLVKFLLDNHKFFPIGFCNVKVVDLFSVSLRV